MATTVTSRKPFQGVGQIIRFNWPYFVIAALVVLLSKFLSFYATATLAFVLRVVSACIAIIVLIPLIVSWYVYDCSPLYELRWLRHLSIPKEAVIVNIHAGFDEMSELLQANFPCSKLHILDFYDPVKHTEKSIRRARTARTPFPGTISINTGRIPLPARTADIIFLLFSAHEIRNDSERIRFFSALHELANDDAMMIVAEHLRDAANLAAYSIGAFHFLTPVSWQKTFVASGWTVIRQEQSTPFVTIMMLKKI